MVLEKTPSWYWTRLYVPPGAWYLIRISVSVHDRGRFKVRRIVSFVRGLTLSWIYIMILDKTPHGTGQDSIMVLDTTLSYPVMVWCDFASVTLHQMHRRGNERRTG